ncbi:MAG TPA: NADH-quinone oxidoreductase subunit L, partial [Myxococcota bacterium]|nr:NADH-quinone oxidoreductase subunit L [Myxococcota bacterium]
MLTLVLSIFALGLVAPLAARRLPRHAGWVLAAPLLGVTAWLAARIPAVARGEALRQAVDWVPALQVALSFRLDGLGLLFALIVASIGTLIVVYSGGYLKG